MVSLVSGMIAIGIVGAMSGQQPAVLASAGFCGDGVVNQSGEECDGSAGVGVAFGLRPRPVGMLERIAAIFSRAAVCVIASVLVAPLLIVLTASLAGVAIQLLDPQSDANVPLIVAGGVTGLLLLAVTVTAFVTGIAAIRGKTRGKSAQEQA